MASRCVRRSGSVSMISSAFMVAATAAGGMLALKISGLEKCWT